MLYRLTGLAVSLLAFALFLMAIVPDTDDPIRLPLAGISVVLFLAGCVINAVYARKL